MLPTIRNIMYTCNYSQTNFYIAMYTHQLLVSITGLWQLYSMVSNHSHNYSLLFHLMHWLWTDYLVVFHQSVCNKIQWLVQSVFSSCYYLLLDVVQTRLCSAGCPVSGSHSILDWDWGYCKIQTVSQFPWWPLLELLFLLRVLHTQMTYSHCYQDLHYMLYWWQLWHWLWSRMQWECRIHICMRIYVCVIISLFINGTRGYQLCEFVFKLELQLGDMHTP